jgi:glucarate dehydratase
MKIIDVRTTPVSVPIEAPLRHATGCHWGSFVRTIVEVETDDGLSGLARWAGRERRRGIRGTQALRARHRSGEARRAAFKVSNPTASLYNNRTQMLAALEFACLDILGQAWGVPVSEILGGRLRDHVPFASYLFFRYANAADGSGEVRTCEQLVAQAKALSADRSPGAFDALVAALADLGARALADRLPAGTPAEVSHAVWSTEQAIWFGRHIEDLNNDYLEDPVFGLRRYAPGAREAAHAARHEHRRRELRAARGERAADRRRRDSSRHDVLGRDSPVREGGGRVRHVPARRGGPLVGRARSSSPRCSTSAR